MIPRGTTSIPERSSFTDLSPPAPIQPTSLTPCSTCPGQRCCSAMRARRAKVSPNRILPGVHPWEGARLFHSLTRLQRSRRGSRRASPPREPACHLEPAVNPAPTRLDCIQACAAGESLAAFGRGTCASMSERRIGHTTQRTAPPCAGPCAQTQNFFVCMYHYHLSTPRRCYLRTYVAMYPPLCSINDISDPNPR